MTEKGFFEFVKIICENPKLYTGTGTFIRVILFLEGYALGANVGDNNAHSKFAPFFRWAVKELDIKKTIINWDEFRDLFSSDEEALKNLPVLYKKYIEESIYG